MGEGTVATAIVFTISVVLGIIITSYFYFRSREKQMMIEKGMSYEQMRDFVNTRRDPYTLLKIGIIVIFFGLGIGFGVALGEGGGHNEAWVPLLIFTFTGLGFVLAYLAARKLKQVDEQNEQKKVGE